jgi:hypothetical protein
MRKNMAFFNSFTDEIRQKWLEFFETNREWIVLHMIADSVSTPDGGKRPSSYLILGVVNALEPQLAQLMMPFSKLNPDPDTLIDVLELDFDPDMALGYRPNPTEQMRGVNQQRKDDVHRHGLGGASKKGQNKLDGRLNSSLTMEPDDFGGVSFGSIPGSPEILDDSQGKDILSDVWGEETQLEKSGEDLSEDVFDESELARLFPKP